jgi:hypothetical protein
MSKRFDESLRDLEKFETVRPKPKFGGFGVVRSESKFPVNKFLLLLFVLGVLAYIFRVEIINKALPHIPPELKAKAEALLNPPAAEAPSADGKAGTPGATGAHDPHANAAHTKEAQKPPEKEYVRIDGKYYEKSPTNVYIINGKSIFYKEAKPAAPGN